MKADRDAAERAKDPNVLSESEREELKRLRRKTAQQEIDLEILRKAAAYFARDADTLVMDARARHPKRRG